MSNITEVEVDESYDPNAYVPLWVNIVVPITGGLLFLLVLWILYRTNKEVPVEKLERLVEKIPIISKYLTTEWSEDQEDNDDTKKTNADKETEKAKEANSAHINPVFTVAEENNSYEAKSVGVNKRPSVNCGYGSSTLFDTRL